MAALLQVRAAGERDLPSVVQCDAYAQSSKARRFALERWCAQGAMLLAEVEGQVLGFVVLEHGLFGHGFIPLISVHPSSRRQGVARFLLAEAERHCKTGKLFTSANASNAEAQALFVRTGFVRSGTIENLEPGDPELVYFKALSEHEA